MFHYRLYLTLLSLFLIGMGNVCAEEPVVRQANDEDVEKTATKLLKVDPAEPLIAAYSFNKATEYLDRSSLAWTQKYKCFTCHTNFIHLMATADLQHRPKHFDQVKSALDTMVTKRWKEKGPRWDAEVIMSATALAFVDRSDQNKLSATTKMALDRIWTVQRKDGGFDWLQCDWPPMESDDEYGAAIAAVGLSAAPENYIRSESAKAGVNRLTQYIQTHGLARLHHRALLIWADSLGGDWISDKETNVVVKEILQLQNQDGGWNSPSLGKWKREDGQKTDKKSDGYGTGFALFILQKAGLDKDHKAIQNGVAWLKNNQRASGRWFTRSMSRDNRHYLTNAGTAMAILALSEYE